MSFNFFEYDEKYGRAVLNSADLILLKEFKALLNPERNKCEEDSSGIKHLRADKEFTYIYLAISWKSPYANYADYEKHEAALGDSGLTEEQFNDPVFREACRKFRALQDSNRYVRLLQSTEKVTDKIIDYFDNIDFNATKDDGTPIVKVSEIQKAMEQAVKQIESLRQIEALVKKEVMEQSQIRGGAVEGFMPDE